MFDQNFFRVFFLNDQYFPHLKIDVSKLKKLLAKQKIKEEITIINSKMSRKWTQIIQQITFDSIKNSKNFSDICDQISNSVLHIFGNDWNSMAFKEDSGDFKVTHKRGKYIEFTVSDLTFIIFQS